MITAESEKSLIPALFLHIQKTAGTSIIQMAAKYYGNDNVVTHGDYLKLSATPDSHTLYPVMNLNLEKFQNIQFISGHFGFDFAQQFRSDRFMFTFLRNPVERILSYYYFCRNRDPGEFNIYKLAQTLSLEKFLQLGFSEPIIKACIWNNQAWQLAHGYGNRNRRNILMFTPQEILELSLKHLDEFSFIGFTETFDADCNHALKALGIDPPENIIVSNSNMGHPTAHDLPASTLDLLNQLTEIDQIVYKAAWSKYHGSTDLYFDI